MRRKTLTALRAWGLRLAIAPGVVTPGNGYASPPGLTAGPLAFAFHRLIEIYCNAHSGRGMPPGEPQ